MAGKDNKIPWRYLKGSKSTIVPARVIGLACTYINARPDENHRHVTMLPQHAAYYCNADSNRCIYCPEYLSQNKRHSLFTFVLKALDPRHTNYIVSAHLGRDLSMMAFWLEVETGRFTFDGGQKELVSLVTGESRLSKAKRGMLVINDIPTIISGWYNGVKLVMVDVRNYGVFDRVEPKFIGSDYETLDVSKMNNEGSSRLVAKDVAMDNHNCFAAICNLVLDHDMGVLRHTYSSQAFECYKHRFMHHKILIHQNEPAKDLESSATFGVPSIAYYKGEYKGKVYKLDVCGLYPSVMKDNLFPIKLNSHQVMAGNNVACYGDRGDGVIALVSLDTRVRTYPKRLDGDVMYPLGRYNTVLCWPEIHSALKHGDLLHHGTVITYKMAPIFTDYVDYWWMMRELGRDRSDELLERWSKLMLVSLWGKLGQRAFGWELDESSKSPNQWGMYWDHSGLFKEPTLYRAINWRPYRRITKGFAREAFPAIAAYVCMYARRRMDQLKEICGVRNVLLQVADCLYVTERGRDAVGAEHEIEQGVLGKLRECSCGDSITIHSATDYTYCGEEVIGGIRVDAVKVGETKYVEIHEAKLPYILTGDPARGVPIYEILKTINRVDPPGRIGPDGWIEPPIVEEW